MLFQIGVAYETSPQQLAEVSALVERAILSVEGTRFEYCALRNFGEHALNFEVVYFVPEWDQARLRFVAINDAVSRAIHAAFAAAGIAFAYPTRNVIVRQ